LQQAVLGIVLSGYVLGVGVIRVEPEEPTKAERCIACGGTNRLMHGYVYEDDYPHGLYFLEWCDGQHPRKAAFLTIGLGAFGEGSDGNDRLAFCLEWSADGMGLTSRPARDNPSLLGRFLGREEALAIPNVEHLWHVADHIVRDDPRAAQIQPWIERT
jgi:hypothetical protein